MLLLLRLVRVLASLVDLELLMIIFILSVKHRRLIHRKQLLWFMSELPVRVHLLARPVIISLAEARVTIVLRGSLEVEIVLLDGCDDQVGLAGWTLAEAAPVLHEAVHAVAVASAIYSVGHHNGSDTSLLVLTLVKGVQYHRVSCICVGPHSLRRTIEEQSIIMISSLRGRH